MFFLSGTVCLAYYFVIRFYVGKWKSTFSRFWAVCGIFSVWMGILMADVSPVPAVAAELLCFFCWAAVCIAGLRMFRFGQQPVPDDLEYLVVLGAKVDRTRITNSLRLRLDRAYEYAMEHDHVRIIVSGGQGHGEDLPEAIAMRDYLVRKGIDVERILTESSSSTTLENLRFTARIVPGIRKYPTGLVTNSFHLYRSCLLAGREGYEKIFPVSAESEKILFWNYMVREVLAVLILDIAVRRNRH